MDAEIPIELAADELIRAINAGEKVDPNLLKIFILRANAQNEINRKTRIKEEAKNLKPSDVDFF